MAVKKLFFSKKSMIFTIVAILLAGVLIAQTIVISKTTYKQQSFVAVSRVNSMNDFIGSVEEDVVRSMFIAGYRAVISMQKHLATNGTFINVSSVFSELFVNGTVKGSVIDIMENSSINDWALRINDEALKLNININITPYSVLIYHDSPWSVVIRLNATFNVIDINNLASWYYNKSFEKEISIVGFEDPLYTIGTSDKVTNLIIITNSTDFVNDTNNDTSVLVNHVNMSYYINSTEAPSFLMRFEGNLSPSQFGIESIVNRPDLVKQSIAPEDKSFVDYQYFDDAYTETSDKCNFNGMPSWFRIGPGKLDEYELTGMGSNC